MSDSDQDSKHHDNIEKKIRLASILRIISTSELRIITSIISSRSLVIRALSSFSISLFKKIHLTV
ncbi:9040_t:CDS:2 [Cetraspora pellucida]|uniref:9040_t:CDS:1 n=1 Tax=Cetraspora pellucida TaxID=1433469 RepID=A0A9N9GHF5_9GLOM|nr:9040_t:CDS:2 [Cetraspora pellucida]